MLDAVELAVVGVEVEAVLRLQAVAAERTRIGDQGVLQAVAGMLSEVAELQTTDGSTKVV